MTRALKLMTLAAMGAWWLTTAGCDTRAYKEELRICKQEATELRKESAASMYENQELKMQLAEAQANLASLTGLNDDLKKKIVEVAATGSVNAMARHDATKKHEIAKGKHKKRGRS